MKILIAVHHFPPTFKGGAEWRAHRTAKWLQDRGHVVRVICVESINDPATADLRWVDETFDSLAVRRLFLNLPNATDLGKWEYDNPWIGAHLAQYLAEEKPDIFHLISGYLMTAAAIRAAKSLEIPVVLTLTDFWFLCLRHTLQRTSGQVCPKATLLDCTRCFLEKKRRFRLPAQWMPTLTSAAWRWMQASSAVKRYMTKIEERAAALQTAIGEVDIAICPSNFLKQTYVDRGFLASDMRFMRQGLSHIPERQPKKTFSPWLRLGYIGQIAPHKGVHTLIEAFLKLAASSSEGLSLGSRAGQLKLYGDTTQFPDYYRELQKKAAHNKQIQFLGTFDNSRIGEIYEGLDVLVVPSTWYENSPNVILEAFSHQTPVIASDLGGMAELIDHDVNGLLFEAGNVDSLVATLQRLLAQSSYLSKLQKGIPTVKTVSLEMQELLDIYTEVKARYVTSQPSIP
jgi:glycosyltransferase involved in cell wall biosynthesis